MKVNIRYGINLKSYCSVVEYVFENSIPTEIIEIVNVITKFHPVFAEKVNIFPQIIEVHSYLPRMWKEASLYLEKLESNPEEKENIKTSILENVIKTQVLSMSTIPILYSASRKKLEITQFYISEGIIPKPQTLLNRYYCIGCGCESEITVSSASSKDSHIGQKTQKDKWTTNKIIDRLGIPIAKWEILESEEHLKEIWNYFPKPCVIKPSGLTGGSGVTTNIMSLEKALSAFSYAYLCISAKDRPTWQRKIMIQQQVEGEDYRILVINGRFKIATKRIPAFVIGNGTNTLSELIEETNKDPRRDILNPTHVLKPIQFDEPLTEYLNEQGLSLDFIPTKDQKIRVRKPASMSQGGLTEDFTDKVHPQIINICESIAKATHIYAIGIDLFCKDISKPLTIENGTILEINSMSEMYLNLFPAFGKQYPEVSDEFVSGLLEEKEKVNRTLIISEDIVTNGNGELTINIPQFSSLEHTGIYFENSIYLSKYLLKSGIDFVKGTEALKINSNLRKIVIVFRSLSDFEQNGSGFNYIDNLYINKNLANQDTLTLLKEYQNNNYINKITYI